MDSIRIDDLNVSCIVGILPEERDTAQPLIVSVEASLDLTDAATTESFSRTIDYGALATDLRFILERGRFRLLETAALALCHYLALGTDVRPERVTVTLTKPRALGGHGVPTVTVSRSASDLARGVRERSVLWLSKNVAVGRVRPSDDNLLAGLPTRHDRQLADGSILRVWTP